MTEATESAAAWTEGVMTSAQGYGDHYEANLIGHLRDGLGMHLMQKIRTRICDNFGQLTAGLGNPFNTCTPTCSPIVMALQRERLVMH